MKRLGLIVSLLVVVNVFLMGQNFDSLMVKKHLDCEDISYNSALIFERYYNENKLDSAHSILTNAGLVSLYNEQRYYWLLERIILTIRCWLRKL